VLNGPFSLCAVTVRRVFGQSRSVGLVLLINSFIISRFAILTVTASFGTQEAGWNETCWSVEMRDEIIVEFYIIHASHLTAGNNMVCVLFEIHGLLVE
jgi:hypothetical protein